MNEKVRITCHLARMQGGMLKFIKTKELRKEMLMKKGTCKKTAACVLAGALVLSMMPIPGTGVTSAAAAKVKLNKKQVTVTVKKKTTIKVKNAGKKKIKVKMANKKIAAVKVSKKKLVITGKKAGKTKLTVTVKGMKNCSIPVIVKKANTAVPKTTKAPVTTETPSADQEAKDPGNTGLAAGDTSVLEKKAGKMRDITSQQLIKEMKIGWNLGNSLDVCEADTDGDGKVNQTPKPGKKVDETLWGNVETTQKLFDSLKKDGINAVRIPVTWRDHIIDKKKNTIDPAWMDRVEEVARYAYTNGMYVIINLHHDGGGDPDFGAWIRSASEGDKTKTEVFERYKALWTQIASRFQNYSDYLIFESMNEVGFDDMEENKAFALLNEFNQTFVDTVRSSGGNNAKRHLLIAGYWTDIEKTCTGIENGTFKMPKDTIKDREILSVHYYTPWQFCTTNQQNTWGSKEEIKQMHDLIDQLDKTCVKKEIPVIVGEYGFGPNDPASCRYFVENFVKYTYDKGIASFLWDNGEQYDRTKMEWKMNGLIDALKRATSHKSYTINKK